MEALKIKPLPIIVRRGTPSSATHWTTRPQHSINTQLRCEQFVAQILSWQLMALRFLSYEDYFQMKIHLAKVFN